jgi:hypothetical protein
MKTAPGNRVVVGSSPGQETGTRLILVSLLAYNSGKETGTRLSLVALLAFNLIRGVIAEAARGRDVHRRELSFNRARQTVRAVEQTHVYERNQIVADFPVPPSLIVQKRPDADSPYSAFPASPRSTRSKPPIDGRPSNCSQTGAATTRL